LANPHLLGAGFHDPRAIRADSGAFEEARRTSQPKCSVGRNPLVDYAHEFLSVLKRSGDGLDVGERQLGIRNAKVIVEPVKRDVPEHCLKLGAAGLDPEGEQISTGNYYLQEEWSNAVAGCVQRL
jgi:hypothetical protein